MSFDQAIETLHAVSMLSDLSLESKSLVSALISQIEELPYESADNELNYA